MKIFQLYEYDMHCRFVLGDNVSNPLICIGINPSVATDEFLDPTITRVRNVAKCNGYNGVIMLNISPEISTEPNNMQKALNTKWHKKNLTHIKKIFVKHSQSDILACWRNNIAIRVYLMCALKDIYNLALDRSWKHLGTLTKGGNPRHPLYVKSDSILQTFDIVSYIQNKREKLPLK